jgi:hypothetical protein
MLATRSARVVPVDLIAKIFGEEIKLWSFSICIFLRPLGRSGCSEHLVPKHPRCTALLEYIIKSEPELMLGVCSQFAVLVLMFEEGRTVSVVTGLAFYCFKFYELKSCCLLYMCVLQGHGAAREDIAWRITRDSLLKSRGSSVSIVTTLRALRPRYCSQKVGKGLFLFTTTSRPTVGPTQPPVQWVRGALCLELKRPWHEGNHSPSCSAEIKNAWNCTSTPPYVLIACFLITGTVLPFVGWVGPFRVLCLRLIKQEDNFTSALSEG